MARSTPTLSRSAIDLAYEDRLVRLRAHARRSMLGFTKAMHAEFRINWHHRVICSHLDQFVTGKILRLMIFVEPQTGKSELTSRMLPAFILGHDPDHRIIGSTYGDAFASEFNLDVQRIIDSDRYRLIFPGTRLAGPGTEGVWKRNSSVFHVVGRRGKYQSMGTGGSATGKTANTWIIDDPIKNEREARNVLFHESQFKWYTQVGRSRLRRAISGMPPRILLTMTRWHEMDLAARLLKLAKDNPSLPQWVVLRFPAIRGDEENPLDPRKYGEPLWPEMRPLSELNEIKITDIRTWESLYQQNPTPPKGTVIQREWFRYYEKLPEKLDGMLQSWDLTFEKTEKGSFVVGQVWGWKGPDKYLIHQYRERIGFTDQVKAVRKMCEDYPLARKRLVEKKANGAALIDTIRKDVSGIIPVEPNGSKENRAEAVSPDIRSGNVYLPDKSIAPWVQEFVEECAAFPNGKNDDQVDAMSQALSNMRTRARTDITVTGVTARSKWLGRT